MYSVSIAGLMCTHFLCVIYRVTIGKLALTPFHIKFLLMYTLSRLACN